jgi:hypothetical protein
MKGNRFTPETFCSSSTRVLDQAKAMLAKDADSVANPQTDLQRYSKLLK